MNRPQRGLNQRGLVQTLRQQWGNWLGRSGRWWNRSEASPSPALKPHDIDWVLSGELAIGPAPGPHFLPHLVGRRIEVILSLCSELEQSLPEELSDRFCCLRVPLPDSRHVRVMNVEELAEAVELLQWNLLKRRPVYVHCLAGIERSPLVCMAYLCRYRQMDLVAALGWLHQVHPPTHPQSDQLQVVREYLNTVPPSSEPPSSEADAWSDAPWNDDSWDSSWNDGSWNDNSSGDALKP